MLSPALARLDATCRAVAAIDGVAALGVGQLIEAGWFVISAPFGNIRVDGTLTAPQQAAMTAAVLAFSPTPTVADSLEVFGGRGEAAVLLKLSTQWAQMNAAQQAKIQAIIDQLAGQIIQVVT